MQHDGSYMAVWDQTAKLSGQICYLGELGNAVLIAGPA